MNISICVPSYKRPNDVITRGYLGPIFKIYANEEEVPEYQHAHPDMTIMSCPPSTRKNIAAVRNHILRTEFEAGADAVCMTDDDNSGMFFWEKRVAHKIQGGEEFIRFLERYTHLAAEWGVKLWGVNINQDKQIYREYSPFSTLSYISASFMVFLRGNECWFDKRLPLKEDYDMTLQQIHRYGGVLRLNKFFYKCKQSVQPGGCASYRNIEFEKAQLLALQRKWGKKIVRIDTNERSHNLKKLKKKIDYNPIIKVPIKGI